MPSRCCIPGCRSNYDNGPKASIFKFPKDEDMLKKWIHCIPRQNFEPTKASRVCELHFASDDIKRHSEFYDEKAGKNIRVSLKQPRLNETAVPSLFPNCPKYLSKDVSYRETPACKRRRIEAEQIESAIAASLQTSKTYDETFKFSSIAELHSCLENINIPKDWVSITEEESVTFLLIKTDPFPQVLMSVKIDSNLQNAVYFKNVLINDLKIQSTFENVHQITTALDTLSKGISDFEFDHFDFTLALVKNSLKLLLKYANEKQACQINFLLNQVSLLNLHKNHRKYSNDTLILSCLLFAISPHAYKFLRNSGMILLPHPVTILRICGRFNASPKIENNNAQFMTYIKKKAHLLKDDDKNVVLQIDEIHVKPFVDFRGGSILGLAFNSDDAATSAYVFMIESIKSKYKDVVHILPVKTFDAKLYSEVIQRVIISLESFGLKVICVITDNISINKKAMMLFNVPPKLQIAYKHPADPKRPLFYMFDSVHLFKSIRNNWFNQKTGCLYFPQFVSCNKETVETASLSALKKIYGIEENGILKYSYGLTLKALHPNNLERQNVKLVGQIFNLYVIESLRKLGPQYNLIDYEGTANFIEIVLRWFSIMNVRTPFKGIHKRDEYQEPLSNLEGDVRKKFLDDFYVWLVRWEEMKCNIGTFTSETHVALRHTTYCITEIAKYCIEELGFKYILTGKFQTDSLEDRFGKYRQLAGSNYNISVTNIFENETKLRIQSLISCIRDFNSDIKPHKACDTTLIESYYDALRINETDLTKYQALRPILTYVAGYCCHSVLKKLGNCSFCKNVLVLDEELCLDDDFCLIKSFDRGNLKYPSNEVISIVLYNYIIIDNLLCKFKARFLKENNQRDILISLAYLVLCDKEIYLDVDDCPNSHDNSSLVNIILSSSSNIFLKNFCRNQNDSVLKSKKEKQLKSSLKKKNRKLQTFNK